MTTDRYGRHWNLADVELCNDCGQPDNCGDCNHEPLTDADADALASTISRDTRGRLVPAGEPFSPAGTES